MQVWPFCCVAPISRAISLLCRSSFRVLVGSACTWAAAAAMGVMLQPRRKASPRFKQDIGVPELAFASPSDFTSHPSSATPASNRSCRVIVELGFLVPGDSVGLDLRLFLASHNLLLVPVGAPLYTFVLPGVGSGGIQVVHGRDVRVVMICDESSRHISRPESPGS